MVSPPFGRNNLSSTDNSILPMITAFVNIKYKIHCKNSGFSHLIEIFQNKKLSEMDSFCFTC